MTLGYVYFGLCAVLAVLGAIATVASPNPIRGAMGLLLMIVSIAGLFLALHAQFLGAIQLIVYAGAIVVLFIFVIMLLGPSATSPSDSTGRVARYAGAMLFGAIGIAGIGLLAAAIGRKVALPPQVDNDFGSIDAIGRVLFTDALVPFELSSALLIVAVVGALAIARGKQGGDLLANEAAKSAKSASASATTASAASAAKKRAESQALGAHAAEHAAADAVDAANAADDARGAHS